MNELQIKQLAFLEETKEFYNLTNRCYNEAEDKCLYSPIATSPGCAIGRKIDDKELCGDLDKLHDGQTNSTVSTDYVFEKIPEYLKSYGRSFLSAVQWLHDVIKYWDQNGLNELGLIEYNRIKNLITTNCYATEETDN